MTEKEIMKKFCEEQLEVDIETLNERQLMVIKESLAYGMYALQQTFKEVGRVMKSEFRKSFLK